MIEWKLIVWTNKKYQWKNKIYKLLKYERCFPRETLIQIKKKQVWDNKVDLPVYMHIEKLVKK